MAQAENFHTEFINETLSDFNELNEEEYHLGSERTEECSSESHLAVNEYEYEYCEDDVSLDTAKDADNKHKRHHVDTDLLYCSSEKVLKTINYESSEFGEVSDEGTLTPTLDWVRSEDSLDTEMCKDETRDSKCETSADIEGVSSCNVKHKNLILVRFTTRNGEMMTSNFSIDSKIFDLKERIAKVFRITRDDFDLLQGKLKCEDLMPLSYFIVSSPPVDFVIRSRDHDKFCDPGEFSSYRPAKDCITARVPLDVGGNRLKSVLIENQSFTKEWLGGYRNQVTKTEYHHAGCQTEPKKRQPRAVLLVASATQTKNVNEKNAGTGFSYDKATQMWRPDHYIPSVNDRLIKADPKRFKGGKMAPGLKCLFRLAVTSQRYNKTMTRKYIQTLENLRKKRCSHIEMGNEKLRLTEQLEKNKRLIIDSTFPMNRDDFYLLYLLIGKWWRESCGKLKQVKKGAALKSALMRLLTEEIDLIWMIERKRIRVKNDLLMKQEMHFLETCARPIIFRDNKGVMSSVDTLTTQQARELLEMMSSFMNPKVSAAQHIDVVNMLKAQLITYGFHDANNEIIELLDRECDLIVMGLKRKELKLLEGRVLQLLFQRLRSTNLNPAAFRYHRPCMPKTDFKHYMCVYCNKLKLACDFNVHVRLTSFNMCASCEWTMNIGFSRINYTPFSRMLSDVRQSEMTKCCTSSVAFVLQTVGMHYLVCRIWLAKSILSAKNDLNQLRIVRFRKEEDWTPWNCILLTIEECEVHSAIIDVEQFYNKDLLDLIAWRHLRAKNEFLSLRLNERFMQETKLWPNVQDAGNFLHPSHIVKFAENLDFEYHG